MNRHVNAIAASLWQPPNGLLFNFGAVRLEYELPIRTARYSSADCAEYAEYMDQLRSGSLKFKLDFWR